VPLNADWRPAAVPQNTSFKPGRSRSGRTCLRVAMPECGGKGGFPASVF
jgi:hypothetical protein